jgi:hypothetical protein
VKLQLALVNKGIIIQPASMFYSLFIGALLALAIAFGFLYRQNRVYQQKNKNLIIQNDSILSVNIELTKALQQRAVPASKKQSVSFKGE